MITAREDRKRVTTRSPSNSRRRWTRRSCVVYCLLPHREQPNESAGLTLGVVFHQAFGVSRQDSSGGFFLARSLVPSQLTTDHAYR